MVAEAKFTEKKAESMRDETLKLSMIDTDYLEKLIQEDSRNFKNSHEDFFEQRRDWLLALRDLRYQYRRTNFEDASDLHVPYSLIMSKAMHAKIFQVFSQDNLFAVEANNIAFSEDEETVKNFMDWTMQKWLNRGRGFKDVLDEWIQQVVDEGTGTLKLWWDRWEHSYIDLDIEIDETQAPIPVFTPDGIEMEESGSTKAKFKNVKKTLRQAAPAAGIVDVDDLFMPPGQLNIQQSPWVIHRLRMRDEDLKIRAKQKKFDMDVVEEAIERRSNYLEEDGDNANYTNNTRRDMRELEGVEDDYEMRSAYQQGFHTVYEWYGRAYVEKDVSDETLDDVDALPQEIVVWYHVGIKKILGWTYLHRISPSGRRPFYKADFIPSKERAFGIGVGELLWSLNNHIDAMHNLKLDNGILSSLQFGFYRAGSAFKPDTFRLRPGDMIPVEDISDIKMSSVPYLGQFGENEELSLTGYGEKLLAINDINLGNLTGRGVAGALRNATGASFVDRQASIQLNPHLDRIARELTDFLSDLFILTRSRMNPELQFRVTGEDGKGIFGDISREQLRGEFDFTIRTDIAAASEAEKQQRASLMLQTLSNPMYQQLGIIDPGNVYETLKEFLIRHNIKHPEKFITKPAGYTGPPLTPDQRLLRIMLNNFDEPPIEDSVRLDENHERAIETFQEFQDSDLFGVFTQDQLAAYQAVLAKHEQFMAAQAASPGGGVGLPNMTGTQLPTQGGLPPLGPETIGPGGSEGGPLGSPLGEVNGPVQ